MPFHGDELDAVQDGDGKVWVSLRRCCENLGLAYSAQLQKLKTKHWATVLIINTVADDKKSRSMVMIGRRTLLMWLAGIKERKVEPGRATRCVDSVRAARYSGVGR